MTLSDDERRILDQIPEQPAPPDECRYCGGYAPTATTPNGYSHTVPFDCILTLRGQINYLQDQIRGPE